MQRLQTFSSPEFDLRWAHLVNLIQACMEFSVGTIATCQHVRMKSRRAYGVMVTMWPCVFDELGMVGRIALMFVFVLLLGMAIARHQSIERGHLAMFVSIEVFALAGRRRL
jgi:hypothetical protein